MTLKFQSLTSLLATAALGAFLGACNTSTSALDPEPKQAGPAVGSLPADKNAGSDASATESGDELTASEETAGPKIIRESPTVSQKGTYIRALVNGEPITNYDIQRRAKLRQLRRESAGQEATLTELVDEKLKIQEARRRNTLASDSQVAEAFANFARSNKSTTSRIGADLNQIGVGETHFKEFIRAQISWQRTIGTKARSEAQRKSQSEAIFELRKAGETKPEVTEYRLQQIVFVIPSDRRSALMKTRKNEALNFKQRFSSCEESFELAKSLRDVTVKNLGRMMQPEIPNLWREAVTETEVGQLTAPKETEKGVELLAVCESRVTSDDRAAQISAQAQSFEDFQTKSSETSEEFLTELRNNATIVYR